MQMRDQHGIRTGGGGQRASLDGRNLATQVRDVIAQHRVGEQAHTVQLDQDGGVPEENDTVRGGACATGESRAIDHKREGSNEMLSAINDRSPRR